MYLFYEEIKKEIDLQDLVSYLEDPLKRLKVLELKIEEYATENKNHEDILRLTEEINKLTKVLFPDLIHNYCKLSLEFRNKNVIKQIKNNNHTIGLTSKDLLLKNIAKLIEHIQLMEDKFYKCFSFDFLVDSRVISELGFQKNYLDEVKELVVLENKYVFSKTDADKSIEKTLNKKGTNTKLLEKNNEEESIDVLLEKKQKDERKKEEEQNSFNRFVGISFLVLAFLITTVAVTLINKDKMKKNDIQSKSRAFISSNLSAEDVKNVLKEINDNINNIKITKELEEKYKESIVIMNNVNKLQNINDKEKISFKDINYINLINNGFTLSPQKILLDSNTMKYNASSYNLQLVNNKVQLKINNLNKEECNFIGLKLTKQYDIKVGDKTADTTNLKNICEYNHEITLIEK